MPAWPNLEKACSAAKTAAGSTEPVTDVEYRLAVRHVASEDSIQEFRSGVLCSATFTAWNCLSVEQCAAEKQGEPKLGLEDFYSLYAS